MNFSFLLAVALVTTTLAQECDGETTRSCLQCVALTELGSNCKYCKNDARCVGNFDTTTAAACSGGFVNDAAGCTATPAPPTPPPPPACDGETTRSCLECVLLTESGTTCNFCKSDNRCQGDLDISVTCAGGYVTSATGCSATPAPTPSTAMPTPTRTPATPMPTPSPTPMMAVLRPSFANICFEYRASCDSPTDFCSFKGKYMSCATRSDRCGDYNALSALFDSKCPAIKCQCTSVLNSCLADGSPVAVQCTAPGMVDNCAHCTDCDCEKRCCTAKCTAKSMVVASVDCVMNNDLTFADCRCGSKPTGMPTPTPTLALAAVAACAPGTAGCFCSATVKCDVSNATCDSGICLIRGCVKGEAGCPCVADNTCIGDGLECRDGQCVFPNPCTMAGVVAGCQCSAVGACVGALKCDVPSNVCLNVRQYTCNPGDDGCWCKSDDSCSSDRTRCVDKGFGRKSCVYAVQPTPVPTPCTSLMCPCRSSADCSSSKCWQNVCRDCSACSVDTAIIVTIKQASVLNVQTEMTDRACVAYAEYRKCLFSLCSFQDASSKNKDNICGMDASITEVIRIARERVCPGLCDPVDVSASISCAPLWWMMLPSLLLQP